MVQYWHVLNLDKRQTLGQDAWGELHDIMSSTAPDALVYQLIATPPDAPHTPGPKNKDNSNDNTDKTDNALSPTSPNATALSASRGQGPDSSWSGHRIVVISDYALSYPEGMLTISEMDEVEDMYLDSEEDIPPGEESHYAEDDPAPTLYAFAEEWYSAVPLPLAVDVPVAMEEEAKSSRGEGYSKGVWYLRNLGKKEYVRSDKVKSVLGRSGAGTREWEGKGLGHALIVLACWTSEPERFGLGAEVGEGRWAGDRLDVVLGEEEVKDGWKDVSEEVVKVLEGVWKSLSLNAL